MYAVADFCLIPIGLGTPSVAREIAAVQRVLADSGLEYRVEADGLRRSGYGTNLEGEWEAVMKVIGDCHAAVHATGAPRIATDIRIGTRTDRDIAGGGNDHKVRRVEEILAEGAGTGADAGAGGQAPTA